MLHPSEPTVLWYYLLRLPKVVCFFVIQLASHLHSLGLIH